MKYGLRSDHSKKAKWKISMEQDIANLKMDVCTLKHQLKSSLDIINTLMFNKDSATASFNDGNARKTSVKEEISASVNSRNDCKSIDLKIKIPFKIEVPHFVGSAKSPETFAPPPEIAHYRPTLYKESGDVHMCKRLNCIAAMAENMLWSLEELRFDFYQAAIPKPSLEFGPKNVMSGTKFIKYYPVWNYDPTLANHGFLHCVTTKIFQDKSLEELRLEDYVLHPVRFSNKNDSASNTFTEVQSPIDTMPVDDGTCSHIQEEPLSQIAKHLERINGNLISLNTKCSNMDSNLLEINSQVSVMDSRLSAIDMFVTMQQVDKRWQDLTTRLQAIQNNSPGSNTLCTKITTKEDALYPVKELELVTQKMKMHDYSSPPLAAPGRKETKHAKETLGNISEDIITKNNALMSVSSNNCGNSQSIGIEQSDFSASSEETILEEIKLSKECPSHSSVDKKVENSKLKVGDVLLLLLKNQLDKNNSQIIECKSERNTSQQDNNLPISLKSDSDGSCDSKSKHSTPLKAENILDVQIRHQESEEHLSDSDNEFIFIEKANTEGMCDQRSKEAENCEYACVNEGYKVCSNITEYLEVNLGKKKDSVYDFSFEVKADSSIEELIVDSSASQTSPKTTATNMTVL